MGRRVCTEPQCLYSRVIPLLPLWAVGSVESLSVCTSVHFTYFLLTYLLTYSMVQSPYWEAKWFAASQEIPSIFT